MLLTFLLGTAAGAGAAYFEPHLNKALEGVLLSEAPFGAAELRGVSLAVCLLVAAVLSHIFGGGAAFALALGAVLGAFGPRLFDLVQKRKGPDYGDDL